MKKQLLGICLLLAFVGPINSAEPAAKILEVKKIWSKAPHNAFTDLLFHNDHWYCVFREGTAHVSPDGALRVLVSRDGDAWESAALVTMPEADLRDAKISVAPDGRLCLCGAAAWHEPREGSSHQSFLWYSHDGHDWGIPIPIGDPGFWIWRITWHKGTAYGVGYQTGRAAQREVRLYRSDDGRNFQPLVEHLNQDGFVNETSLLFLPDETCLALIRRDSQPNGTLFGESHPPYTEWSFQNTNVPIGGPQLLQLPDERILAAGRRYPGGAKTQLWQLNPENVKLTELATLPSGGDCSYPGLVFREGVLWMSYYSSHEGSAAIYLAKIELPPVR